MTIVTAGRDAEIALRSDPDFVFPEKLKTSFVPCLWASFQRGTMRGERGSMVDTHKGHVRAFKNNPTITIDSVRHASDATRVAISHPRGQDFNCRE